MPSVLSAITNLFIAWVVWLIYPELVDCTCCSLTGIFLTMHLRTAASAVAVTAGQRHSCALLRSGAIVCWGCNSDGQLGTGDRTTRLSPSLVNITSGVVIMRFLGCFLK